MKSVRTAVATALLAATGSVFAVATVGQAAPSFTAIDISGKKVSLADYKGKHVVLEWINPGCPYVRKHYDSANMPATQKDAASKGVVWLAVNSTATGHSDYLAPDKLGAWIKEKGGAPTATLMDTDGKVGKAYGARTTPHMYIVDPAGTLVYVGAIDNKPSARVSDVQGATNLVAKALGESLAGKPVSQPVTQAYGCSVKYGD